MKKIILCIFMMTTALCLKSQVPDSTALILIDIQDFYFPGGSLPLDHPEQAARNAAKLLQYFREKKMNVIHVGHLAKSGAGFYESVKPLSGEKVIMKKEVNVFMNTDLDVFLRGSNIKTLVLCGMQTHMCLEGAVRAAHDIGYQCIVAWDACATRDLSFDETVVKSADVQASTLATLKSYGKIVSVKEIISNQ